MHAAASCGKATPHFSQCSRISKGMAFLEGCVFRLAYTRLLPIPCQGGAVRLPKGTRERRVQNQDASSTSTWHVLYVDAPEGAERSAVRTLAQPRVSCPSASGANQAPSLIDTTPRAMRSVTRAGKIVAPR